MRLPIFLLLFFCSLSNAQLFHKKYCYFKVDFKLEGRQIYTEKIVCFTQETSNTDEFKTELKMGNAITDSSIVFTKHFMLGKKRKLKKYLSAHIILQLIARNGDVIQKIDGEIMKEDWVCK
jgi:hypothetical protein